jgi:hypothetical protein
MKKLLVVLTVFALLSCNEQNKREHEALQAKLVNFEAKETEEKKVREYAEAYVNAMNSPNWKTEIRKYLKEGPDADKFLNEEYTLFRKSFPNATTVIKHMAVEGNECILWLEETANYAAMYTGSDKEFRDHILGGIKADNQKLTWNEVWYFDVVDGKFGGKWDFLKDNYAVLKGLGKLKK